MEHTIGEYLHGVIVRRMYHSAPPKYPTEIKVRDKGDGRVFECRYAGYDPKWDRHLYTLRDVAGGDLFLETPEAYIANKCEIV